MIFGVIYETEDKQRRVDFNEYPSIRTYYLTPGQFYTCLQIAEQDARPGEKVLNARAIKNNRDKEYFSRTVEDGIIR